MCWTRSPVYRSTERDEPVRVELVELPLGVVMNKDMSPNAFLFTYFEIFLTTTFKSVIS